MILPKRGGVDGQDTPFQQGAGDHSEGGPRAPWLAGLELEVEDRGDAVVLREIGPFPRTTVEEVYGCLEHDGPPATLAEMDEAVMREALKHR